MAPRFPIDGVIYRSEADAEDFFAQRAWMRTTAGELLRNTAYAHPEKAAVIDEAGVATFAELDRRSESVAAALIEWGLRPGDRALFQVGSNASTFVILYGCFKAGVLPICSLAQFRDLEIGQLAARARPTAYVVQADAHPTFDQTAFARRMCSEHGIPHLVVINGATEASERSLDEMAERYSLTEARAITAPWDPQPEDLLQLQLSGGSTGLPKIIPKFHGEYLASTKALSDRFGLTEDDITLWGLPLIHNAGMLYVVMPTCVCSRTAVILPRFEIRSFLEAIGKHRITFTGSIGPIAARILEVEDIASFDLSSLRQFFALNQADAVQAHTGVPTSNMFGITEGMYCVSGLADGANARHKTVGYPIEEANEIRLVDDASATVPVGAIGELTFRGPHILTGYYNDPEATAACFTTDGWFRTGDLMSATEIDGKLRYVFAGRLKDNINRGGEKFSAEEVESYIVRFAGVADAKVVAMPDRHLGERACCYLVMQPGHEAPTLPALSEFLLAFGLAKYKLPERIEVINEFPLTRVGKVDKAALRTLIASRLLDESQRQGVAR